MIPNPVRLTQHQSLHCRGSRRPAMGEAHSCGHHAEKGPRSVTQAEPKHKEKKQRPWWRQTKNHRHRSSGPLLKVGRGWRISGHSEQVLPSHHPRRQACCPPPQCRGWTSSTTESSISETDRGCGSSICCLTFVLKAWSHFMVLLGAGGSFQKWK